MTADPTTVLCFGDSLTWGFDPRGGNDRLRYGFGERWTQRLQAELGSSFHVIEEGMSGRTTVFDDPVMGDMSGLAHLPIAMHTHMPLDLVLIMLGTNDTKNYFSVNGDVLARCLGRILEVVSNSDCGQGGKAPQMLVVVPPAMGDIRGSYLEPLFDPVRSPQILERLRATYPPIAAAYGAHCFDINEVVDPATIDGVHFEPESLQPIAVALANQIRDVFNDSKA